MKAMEYKLDCETSYLVFNGFAMFEFDEQVGGAGRLMESVQTINKKSFELLCQATALLAEQGELTRRALGYEKQLIPTLEKIRAVATPMDVVGMRAAVMQAIMAGYGREIESDEDVDLVLLELRQKKTST